MTHKRKLRVVAIVAKPHAPEAASAVASLLEWLRRRKLEVLAEEHIPERIRKGHPTFSLARFPPHIDMVIVLGGDGTMLSVVRSMGARQRPILGVNLGSLGFLTEITRPRVFSALQSIVSGEYRIERRLMLSAELKRNGHVLGKHIVLNDVVITKGAIARIIELGVDINNQFVAVIQADGIIVSTPTGSTAYSLAAGGPILYPGIGSMILTPICPHTLTYRPVVVSDHSRIVLSLRSDSGEVYATFDGQVSLPLLQGDIIKVRKSRSHLKLVTLLGRNYFQVLRHKLRWAERPRSRRVPRQRKQPA